MTLAPSTLKTTSPGWPASAGCDAAGVDGRDVASSCRRPGARPSAVSGGVHVADAVAADVVARVGRLGVLAARWARNTPGRPCSSASRPADLAGAVGVQAVVVARVDLAVAQVEDVAVAEVPVVEVVAVLQALGVEAVVLLVQARAACRRR